MFWPQAIVGTKKYPNIFLTTFSSYNINYPDLALRYSAPNPQFARNILYSVRGIPVVGSLVRSSFRTKPSTINCVSLKLPPRTDNPETPPKAQLPLKHHRAFPQFFEEIDFYGLHLHKFLIGFYGNHLTFNSLNSQIQINYSCQINLNSCTCHSFIAISNHINF